VNGTNALECAACHALAAREENQHVNRRGAPGRARRSLQRRRIAAPRGEKMSTPQGWRTLDVVAVRFAVPGEARATDIQPIDSQVGILRGSGYELIYDYGRAGESLSDKSRRAGIRHARAAHRGPLAVEVSFTASGQPWAPSAYCR
jgi:hypothetical protein